MSQLLSAGVLDLNTYNEQHFTLSDGTHSRFIPTDYVITRRNNQTPNSARQPSIRTDTVANGGGHLIMDDSAATTLSGLVDDDCYLSASKGDFDTPHKVVCGPDVYVILNAIEGEDCECNIYIWGYPVD